MLNLSLQSSRGMNVTMGSPEPSQPHDLLQDATRVSVPVLEAQGDGSLLVTHQHTTLEGAIRSNVELATQVT